MSRRAGFAAALVAGVALCTLADVQALPPPAMINGFYVLGADFHVHAAFGDGGLTPWDARREAARRGLHVIAIANHNQVHSPRIHRALFGSTALPLLLTGQEVTTPTHHILAIGVSSAVAWNQSAADTIRDIQSRGGVAIAAHPQGSTSRGYDSDALSVLDAAERTHPGMYRDHETEANFARFFTRARQHNLQVAAIGDSDFHFNGRIGLCRTYLLARELTERGVLEAVRAGRTVAYDLYGNPYGDALHIKHVEAARRATLSTPARWAFWTNIAGDGLVWGALLALALVGPAGFSRATRRPSPLSE